MIIIITLVTVSIFVSIQLLSTQKMFIELKKYIFLIDFHPCYQFFSVTFSATIHLNKDIIIESRI